MSRTGGVCNRDLLLDRFHDLCHQLHDRHLTRIIPPTNPGTQQAASTPFYHGHRDRNEHKEMIDYAVLK